MADIFISYSKVDRAMALKLSALLESHGYTTWWDSSLEPTDKFRDKIMAEIDAARVVISIWSDNSIESDWVRAEAGRAMAMDKFIPVKTAAISYDQIPLPFGEIHTESLDRGEAIIGAVETMLSRPQEKPSLWRMFWAGARHEALSWLGIMGGILTILASLDSLITLANWAHLLSVMWSWWLNTMWSWLFSWVDIDLTTVARFQLTFATSIVLMAVGSRLAITENATATDSSSISIQNIWRLNVAAAVTIYVFEEFAMADLLRPIYLMLNTPETGAWLNITWHTSFYVLYLLALFVGLIHWGVGPAAICSGTALLVSEIFIHASKLHSDSPGVDETLSLWIAPIGSVIAGLIVVYLAYPRSFVKRVWYLLIGLTTILVLSEVSKLGLSLDPKDASARLMDL